MSFEELENVTHTIHIPSGTIGLELDVNGLSGVIGPAGPVGPSGATGPQGEQGPIGPSGVDGAQGPIGPSGETGPQGPQGETGASGVSGSLDVTNLSVFWDQQPELQDFNREGETVLIYNENTDSFKRVDARCLRPVPRPGSIDTGTMQERYLASKNTITQTLKSPNYEGRHKSGGSTSFNQIAAWRCRGEGMSAMNNSIDSTSIGSDWATTIQWGGPYNKVDESTLTTEAERVAYFGPNSMLQAGGFRWHISDMNLLGYPSYSTYQSTFPTKMCETGIFCYTAAGVGSNAGVIENVGIFGFECGIRLSVKGALNNDTLNIRNCQFIRNDVCFTIESGQAVGTFIEKCQMRHNELLIHAKGGGDIMVRDLRLDNQDTLLRVSASGTQLGKSNGDFVFQSVNFDGNLNGRMTLVEHDVDATGKYIARFENVYFNNNGDTEVRATARNGSVIFITNSNRLPPDTKFELHDNSTVVIDNTTMDPDLTAADMIDVNSTSGSVIIRDCYGHSLSDGVGVVDRIAFNDAATIPSPF